MILITGLGNPGKEYEKTRHNVGFRVIDELAKEKPNDIVLLKPQTFMNDSGFSVSKLINFYKVDLNDLIVVHDDVDLPFGEFRFKKGSGTAGHHGVESIFERLGSLHFWRFRIGVGRPADSAFDVEEYVLEKLDDDQTSVVQGFSKELLPYL